MCRVRATSLEERQRIVALAGAGWTDLQIALHLGCSRATVRKWRRRSERGAPLVSRMGRPRQGPLARCGARAPALRELLRTWRQQHPGWGPKTLLAELRRHPQWGQGSLPSRATLARFLQQAGLSRRYHRQIQPAAPARPRPPAPHVEWELDAQGHGKVAGVGLVALVNLNDRCSHARLLSYPFVWGATALERRLGGEDYQLALRLAFTQWGLPERLQVDHDTVFCDPDSASPFPTRLQLWLAALGVELGFIRRHRPTDQGLTERSHQLWEAQVLRGQSFASHSALVAALRERQRFLNWELPCRSLGERPPLVAYPEAARPRRWYRPEAEAALLEVERVRPLLTGGHWYRRISTARTFRLGNQVYRLGKGWTPGEDVEIGYDPSEGAVGTLVCRSADGRLECRHPLRGVEKETLMGDLARIVSVPGYQPSLPFSWEEERVVRLCETLV